MISLILCHPSAGSFNHAIAERAGRTLAGLGLEYVFHDLYAEKFPPELPGPEIPRDGPVPESVAAHCREIARASGIVLVHPNWWGMPPALLTGWVDRVMRPGVAYEFLEGDGGEGVPRGLLCARSAVVFNTSNTFEDRERAVFGDPLERIWKDCVFGLCGVEDFHRRMFTPVVVSTPEQRAAWLDEVETTLRSVFGPR